MTKKIYPNWYLIHIEPELREIVYALRNNGINTECSCAHDMYVQIQSLDLTSEQRDITSALWEIGIYNFTIEIEIVSKLSSNNTIPDKVTMANIQFSKHKYRSVEGLRKEGCDSCNNPHWAHIHYRKVKGVIKDKNKKRHRYLCRQCWELAYEGTI